MHTQEFINACYNLIDLKIIDLDEYQGFLDNFTTTEELDAYLTAREDMSFCYLAGGQSYWHFAQKMIKLEIAPKQQLWRFVVIMRGARCRI